MGGMAWPSVNGPLGRAGFADTGDEKDQEESGGPGRNFRTSMLAVEKHNSQRAPMNA